MRTRTIFSTIFFFCVASAGCTKEPAHTTSSTPSERPAEEIVPASPNSGSVSPALENAWIEVPENMRFRGLANVESAPSWKVRLLQLPAADQSFLGTINERYFGSLGFADEAEQRRLVEQGFPMPEEWMAAREVPDEELERLAKQGEIKAQMFQIDRVSERLAPVLGARGLQNTPEDKELFRQFVETTSMAEQLLRKTKSPFVAYLTGRMFSAGTLGNQPEPIAGAFELAKDLGDGRADGYRSVFVESHPGMDPEAVMASYSGMKSGVGQVAQEKRGD